MTSSEPIPSPLLLLIRVNALTLFCFLFCCGCASTPQRAVPSERTLAPGDCIIIGDAHHRAPENRHVVDAGGDISLKLLGKFHVAGLTLQQAETRIEKEHVAKGIFTNIDLDVLPCP